MFYARIKPMHYRAQKQIIIGFASLIFIGIFGLGLASFFMGRPRAPAVTEPPPEPQKPVFRDIEVIFSRFFEIRKYGAYDAVALIRNPNIEYGSPKVSYMFIFYGAGGEEIARIPGETFILANQSRYVVKSAMKLPSKPLSVELQTVNQTWQRLAPFSPSGLGVGDISVTRDETLNTTSVSGVVNNQTPYNLKNVEVELVLEDPKMNKEVVAAGTTNMQLLDRGTARAFKLSWPYLIPFVDIDARAYSNFFENSNFIQDYGK